MNRDALAKFVLATILLPVPRIAPLSIAREGYVYAGGKYSNVNGRQVMNGQLYAEYQIPSTLLHPYPIVMVHGAGSSGANFMGTSDGREGWAQFFLRQGYAVFVIDQPGRDRAAYVECFPKGSVIEAASFCATMSCPGNNGIHSLVNIMRSTNSLRTI